MSGLGKNGTRIWAGAAVAAGLWFGSSGLAWGSPPYVPDGPQIPTVTLDESREGAAGLPPLPVPPPNGWDSQSIWNMQVVGFNDNQGRTSSDDGWIENQNGRYIVYMANGGGSAFNSLTGKTEPSGTSLIDATEPTHPIYLANIVAKSGRGSSHVAVCGGNTLPNARKNHWYLLRHDGATDQEVWDTTDPSHPFQVTTVLTGLDATHHDWWECDTGIAYLIGGNSRTDRWHETGSHQHVYIYDLSNPAKPRFIREWGLVGQQPTAPVATARSCYNAPSSTCYEGVANPPGGVHQQYSAGVSKNRVYFAYGVDRDGVLQIIDRNKLIRGCDPSFNPHASASCATNPTQADLLYPQISYITMQPNQGGHTLVPIYGVPVPQEQQNFLDGTPQKWDLMVAMSEDTTNDCHGQPWKNPFIIDITDDIAPWPIATPNVGQFPGDFCGKSARFGTHEISREIYPPYYGRLLIAAYFNAGLQVFDIRDPLNPRRVAYFIQAPNRNTRSMCGTYRENTHYCRRATFSDLGEVDDRGYIYNMDRAGSGLTILRLTGDALQVVTGRRRGDGSGDR